MINDFINQFKKIWNTPTPVVKPSELFSTGLKVVLLFGVFYFAIFSFNAPLERIKRDLIEFICVGFSLFCSWLIFRAISGSHPGQILPVQAISTYPFPIQDKSVMFRTLGFEG